MSRASTSPSRRGAAWLSAAATLIVAGVVLLFLPAGELGIDPGAIGFNLVVLGTLSGLYGLSISRPRVGSVVGLGEKQAGVSLLATLFIGGYFVLKLSSLGWDVAAPDRALGRVVGNVVVMSIVAGVVVEVMRRREGPDTVEDERDVAIRRQAASRAHGALLGLLAVFIVSIGFPPAQWTPLRSPVAIANALIGVVMLSELVRYATEVWLYRRDRV